MKVSKNWLGNYIKTSLETENISQILTSLGLEVEGVEKYESIRGSFSGLVVGEVLACAKHPEADRLSVTEVTINGDTNLQIVCGAPNVAKGQKVIVATIGATLYPSEGEPFTIKKSKIRGVESEGMLCAADEIGLGHDHSGIMVLPDDYQVGSPIKQYFEVAEDEIFEIGLTPNRSDATCHLGVAKDLAAYLKVHMPDSSQFQEPELATLNKVDPCPIAVKIVDEQACPRYSGIYITGITVGPSPSWLVHKLTAIGVKSINNVVDVTNFVLHEMGQPLHAFDADKIGKQAIVVQTLADGTPFLALDQRTITLKNTDLIICDGDNKGMCIGGVFGGIDSGISTETTNIFLEAAHFNAGTIRRTSMSHNLRTDAAKIFEKGSDPNITVKALQRAFYLLQTIAGGQQKGGMVDLYPSPILPKVVPISVRKVNDFLGVTLENSEVAHILIALNMEVQSGENQHDFLVTVPTNKADVYREVDVMEEILRIYGFNNIPIPANIKSTISYTPVPDKNYVVNYIANALTAKGFNQIMGLSLVESKMCKELFDIEEERLVLINNTSNIQLDAMRPNILITALTTCLYNQNRQQLNLKLYEHGKSYEKTGESSFKETEWLSICLMGNESEETWTSSVRPSDIFTLKTTVQDALHSVGLSQYKIEEAKESHLFYGLTGNRGPMQLFSLGQIDPKLTKKMGIRQPIFYAQINIQEVITAIKGNKNFVQEISKFPKVRRDLALIIDKNVAFSALEAAARKVNKTILKDVNLFDVYISKDLKALNQKSYALSFIFEDQQKTLQDQEIETIMSQILSSFDKIFNAKLR